MSIIASLNHVQIIKLEGKFTLVVRTEEMKRYLLEMAAKSGLEVDISVKRPSRFFKSKQQHLDYLLENNEMFKSFVDTLGLKLIEI
jgi:hypothetical protein